MTGPVTYVELNTPDLPAASRFLAAVFGWDPPRRRPTLAISSRPRTGSGRCSQDLGGDHHLEPAVAERQGLRVGVQEPRPRAGAPVGPQPGVGQVEGDHLAEAAVQRAGDHALAAADLEGAAGPPRGRAAAGTREALPPNRSRCGAPRGRRAGRWR